MEMLNYNGKDALEKMNWFVVVGRYIGCGLIFFQMKSNPLMMTVQGDIIIKLIYDQTLYTCILEWNNVFFYLFNITDFFILIDFIYWENCLYLQ